MTMKTFESLEQRILAGILDTFPPFHPRADILDEASCQAFYDWMRRLYELLLAQPDLLFPSLHPDDAFTQRFNKSSEKKPKVQEYMRAAQRRIHMLMGGLMALAQQGTLVDGSFCVPKTVKVSGVHRRILEAMGVSISRQNDAVCFDFGSEQLVMAWRWMATREDAAGISRWVTREDILRLFFSRCLFDPDYSYAKEIYRQLFGDVQAFDRLIAYLESHGYERTDNREGQIALDYAKEYGKEPSPLKEAWAERTHGGISFKYDAQLSEPAWFSLRIPMIATLLHRIDEMDEALRRFVIGTNHKCGGCRYCVQLDKTGKRPLACISVEDGGQTYKLCPMLAGSAYCWTRLDAGLADILIDFLAWIDQTLA